jgi:hypothetical protein
MEKETIKLKAKKKLQEFKEKMRADNLQKKTSMLKLKNKLDGVSPLDSQKTLQELKRLE